MTTTSDLIAALAAAKAKRKPVLSDDEKLEREKVAALQAELDAEYRALRLEENEDIVAKYAPTKARAFFDFDPDIAHPATIEYGGMVCTLHSRFVVRHANASDMEVFDDAKRAATEAHTNPAMVAAMASAAESTTKQLGRRCIVYPEPVKGVGANQHYMDIEASLFHFGGASMALGNAAAQLGGLHALVHQNKS